MNLNYPQEVTKCPGGPIGACQIDHKADKGFNLGYVQSDPQVADNGDLTLQYSGGTECHHQFNRSIRIVFSCSKQMVRFRGCLYDTGITFIPVRVHPSCGSVFVYVTPAQNLILLRVIPLASPDRDSHTGTISKRFDHFASV